MWGVMLVACLLVDMYGFFYLAAGYSPLFGSVGADYSVMLFFGLMACAAVLGILAERSSSNSTKKGPPDDDDPSGDPPYRFAA